MKHLLSQQKVDSLRVLDVISTPGIRNAVVLACGNTFRAGAGSYAGAILLTTVPGNDYQPFRIATWYFNDDDNGWQSYGGSGFMSLTPAMEVFQQRTGVHA